MKNTLARRRSVPLDRRLETVQTIVAVGEGRLPEAEVERARSLFERAEQRLALGSGFTVVALAGATGSGKSSLFNALVGAELAEVGVRRPTTYVTSAAVWGDAPANELLDWLEVERRHRVEAEQPRGLVLLDLPDHDSTEVEHRAEVDRLVARVDLFVWVVDPQKYADALLHERYLRPLATHSPVTVVVLNQIDRLAPPDRRTCVEDLDRLLSADGLEDVAILATSATQGLGLEELRVLIADRVDEKRAAVERLTADVDDLVARFRRYCADEPIAKVRGADRRRLVDAMAEAAGAGTVADAVARSHRRKAALATGWPFSRWLRRARPDPLARLHLDRGGGGGRTSLNAGNVQRAEVENAVRSIATLGSDGMPEPWPEVIRTRVMRPTDEVLEDLDRAVSHSDVGGGSAPRWWSIVGLLQKVIALAAFIGFLWLLALFALQWFQLPRPPTPELGELPWPTVLLLGGIGAGLLLAGAAGWMARVGALRRRRRAYEKIAAQIEGVAERHVLTPIADEQRAYRDLCETFTSRG